MKRLLPILSCAAVGFIAVPVAHANLLAYEGFDIPGVEGDGIVGLSGASAFGFADPVWKVRQGSVTAGPGLSHPLLPSPAVGFSAGDANTGSNGMNRVVDAFSAISFVAPPDGSTYWMSFALRVDSVESDFRVKLFNDFNNTSGSGAFVVGTASGFDLQSEIGGGGGALRSATTLSGDNSTHAVLLKYTFSDVAGQDSLTAWLFDSSVSSLSSEPTTGGATVFGDIATGGANNLSHLLIRGGGAFVGFADEIRIGTMYSDVVVVPEPSTYAALLGLGALGLVILRRRR